MILELQFPGGYAEQPVIMTRQVDLQNVTEQQYQHIVESFSPTVNNATIKSRNAISDGFLLATQVCPDANPSDLWHHVLYRTYKANKMGSNPEQSWVRTSGEGLEIAIVEKYNPYLLPRGIRLSSLISKNDKEQALRRMGLYGQIGSSKVDILIEKQGAGIARDADQFGIVGGIHSKVSLAERVSDDIPASRIMMRAGLISILMTLDVKSFPPPHGDLVNRGELGSPASPSDKRRYVEEHGDFSACFSYNLRTQPSVGDTLSGKRIYTLNFRGGQDAFTQFLLTECQRVASRTVSV